MDILDARQWLNRGYRLDNEINALIRMREKIYADATNVTAQYGGERVQTSTTNSRQKLYDMLADVENDINARIDTLVDIKMQIKRVIDAIDDTRLRTVLIERYINFLPWYKIAQAMHYDDSYVRKELYKSALEAAAKLIPQDPRLPPHCM